MDDCEVGASDRCRTCVPGGRKRVLWYQSAASRRSMLVWLASAAEVFRGGWMTTLTYGKDWPTFTEVKRHLDILGKRFRREFGRVPVFWLLEAQTRGAPHFHLLVADLGLSEVEVMAWFRTAWLDITGLSGSSAGSRWARAVNVRPLSGFGGMMGYLAKEMGKAAQKQFTEGDHPGSWWDRWNCEDLELIAPEQAGANVERLARCAAANDLWGTWARYWDRNRGRWVDVMRTFWTGDVADWIVWGVGSLRGPPDSRRSGLRVVPVGGAA